MKNVPASKKAAFDNLAIGFHKLHRQTYRKVYPSTDFTNGVTILTRIILKECLGLVFLFVILFQYDEGWNIITKCFERKERKEKKTEAMMWGSKALMSLVFFRCWNAYLHLMLD